ncbi:hypothetical protein PDIDSM_3935 [Penicillium digitatum]|nr:hypothetical protein PDIDSM_3935 [Penicillium digitatum]
MTPFVAVPTFGLTEILVVPEGGFLTLPEGFLLVFFLNQTEIRLMDDQPSSSSGSPSKTKLDSGTIWKLVEAIGANPESSSLSDREHLAAARQALQRSIITEAPSHGGLAESAQHRTFKGLQDGFEDPVDFIEDIVTAVERDYARETATLKAARKQSNGSDDAANAIQERILQDKKDRDCRLLFRQNVSGRADTWYNHLNRDTRQDWTKLRASCLERYRLPEEDPVAKISRMETQYDGMKQARDETITEYLERADDFHAQYGPEKAHLG